MSSLVRNRAQSAFNRKVCVNIPAEPVIQFGTIRDVTYENTFSIRYENYEIMGPTPNLNL